MLVHWHFTKNEVLKVNVTKYAGFLRIWSHLLKKYLMEDFIFCVVWKAVVKYLRFALKIDLTKKKNTTGEIYSKRLKIESKLEKNNKKNIKY